jgi:predicted dehydrogenase
MLPGVGIFGYDPTAKVLIQLLTHFGFEIHAIWTNNYDIDVNPNILINNSNEKLNIRKELITTSIDHVLLNKNVNLVFVCCQPSLHSQICTKALGKKYYFGWLFFFTVFSTI